MGLSSNNPVVLTVVTAGPSFSRSFSVRITQIDCNSLSKGELAPPKGPHGLTDCFPAQLLTAVCSISLE